jgi:hypothetical protein
MTNILLSFTARQYLLEVTAHAVCHYYGAVKTELLSLISSMNVSLSSLLRGIRPALYFTARKWTHFRYGAQSRLDGRRTSVTDHPFNLTVFLVLQFEAARRPIFEKSPRAKMTE